MRYLYSVTRKPLIFQRCGDSMKMDQSFRPTCVNYGCGKPAAWDGKRWRVHCGHCQKASYGGHPHANGVTPFKTGVCANKNGYLGFKCLIKWTKVPKWAKGMTEIDHTDGDPLNHEHSNLKELCPICHKLKGQLNGDTNGYRRSKK